MPNTLYGPQSLQYLLLKLVTGYFFRNGTCFQERLTSPHRELPTIIVYLHHKNESAFK
jgi:hypothetical protein